MLFRKIKSLTGWICVASAFFFIAGFFITGCAPFNAIKKTKNKIVRNIKSSDRGLNKKICITPFKDHVFFEKKIEQNFNKNLVEAVRQECSNLLIISAGDKGYPEVFNNVPKLPSGLIDNFALAKTGKKTGLAAIVTGNFTDLTAHQKKRGILFFKRTVYTARLRINAKVYTPETGAKLLDEFFVYNFKVDETKFKSITEAKIKAWPKLTDALIKMVDAVSGKICDAVSREPWKGYVISVAADTITISSGSKAGLAPEDILEVYDCSDIISGQAGHRFFLPGLKISEIKIKTVYPEKAEAVIISGGDVDAGSSVRFKK